MERSDRRVARTKAAIYQALNDLMLEKKYSNITIQDIIDRANVGRTTFYSHFMDKDELLYSCIETVFESFHEQMTQNVLPEQNYHFIGITTLFTHIQKNEHLIIGILSSESGKWLIDKFRSYWDKKIESYLLECLPKGKQPIVPINMLTNYISGTLMELIRWWMKMEKRFTPEQMENYFKLLIFPTIEFCAQGSQTINFTGISL